MQVEGIIIAVLEKRSGTSQAGNHWASQEYVIETQEQYPKKLCFEVYGDEKINQFNIVKGEQLRVSIDFDSRQWNDRWFNSMRAWQVERIQAG